MDNGGFMGYETREGINGIGEIKAEDTTKCAWNRKAGIESTEKGEKKKQREQEMYLLSGIFEDCKCEEKSFSSRPSIS